MIVSQWKGGVNNSSVGAWYVLLFGPYYEHLTKILRWTKFNADFQVECKRQFVTYVSIKQINKKSDIVVIKISES